MSHELSSQLPQPIAAPSVPVPLEQLRLPRALSGVEGKNRAPLEDLQLTAKDDISAVVAWLTNYLKRPATLDAYRREAERFLLWAVIERGKPLSSLTHEDLVAYRHFLADPQPRERWMLKGKKKLPRGHADWRPFAGTLSSNSVEYAHVVLSTCFKWLQNAGYLNRNPFALVPREREEPPRVERFLSTEMWLLVKTTIEQMPVTTQRERLHAARCRWLFTVLYIGGLRASEVTGATMGSLFGRRDSKGIERWWLKVTGKGGKTRDVPATSEMMTELKRYRIANDLPPLPRAGEPVRPLVLPVIAQDKGRPLTRGALHRIIKEVFHRTAARVRQTPGPESEALAAGVERASAHWMRHTAGTQMADHIDLRFVRDNFGHNSISTTSIYLHSEANSRHDATERYHHADWNEGEV